MRRFCLFILDKRLKSNNDEIMLMMRAVRNMPGLVRSPGRRKAADQVVKLL